MFDLPHYGRIRLTSPTRSRLFRLIVCSVACAGHGSGFADEAEYPEAFEPCVACHAYQPDGEQMDGPTLWGVTGRKIASVDGYEYSTALKGLGGTWDRATLDRFIKNPKAMAPGARMTFGGVRDAADRAAILDFLELLGPGVAKSTGD
jgi:cytochrome c